MTDREKEIWTAAHMDAGLSKLSSEHLAFERGATWADEHPKSKYNISDPDCVRVLLESIIEIAQRTTSGNVSHNIASIRSHAQNALSVIKEIKQ